MIMSNAIANFTKLDHSPVVHRAGELKEFSQLGILIQDAKFFSYCMFFTNLKCLQVMYAK